MQNKTTKIALLVLLSLSFSCSNDKEVQQDSLEQAKQQKIIDVTRHDGKPFSTGVNTSANGKFVAGPGGGVMMQAFY